MSKTTPATPIGFNLKADLLQRLNSAFSRIEDLKMYAYATILDPRFKKVVFSSALLASKAAGGVGKLIVVRCTGCV